MRRVLELEPELADADLPDATITEEQLAQCRNLKGATMPDGQRLKSGLDPDGPTFEEWLKDKEGRREEKHHRYLCRGPMGLWPIRLPG